jgi:voltage-gated potassium channel
MLKQINLSRLWLALGLLAFSFAVGVGGFMLLENYPFIDAFYMTVITASTVGFGEVHPLSDVGRVFVSFYILFNLRVSYSSWAVRAAARPRAASGKRPW